MPFELVSEDEISEEEDEKVDDKLKYIIDYFSKQNPDPKTELKYTNPFELLVATILSAQATDKRVNMITPKLFEAFPTPEKLAQATPEQVYDYISSISYPGNKSEYLVKTAKMLVSNYHSKVPENENELQKLSGVGRKTAHVIASTLFNRPVIAVDTHVFRVAKRIGLTNGVISPLDSEQQLMRIIPKDIIPKMNHWLILHGRYVCIARSPKCSQCGIRKVCRYFNKKL